MERGWYFRFFIVIAVAVGGWLVVWPSLDRWVPAPEWVETTFAGRISPGLDIQGGLRLMYEVEVDEAIRDRRDREADRLLKQLGEVLGVLDEGEWDEASREDIERIREKVKVYRVGEGEGARASGSQATRIRVEFEEASDTERLDRAWLRENFPDLREVSREGRRVVLELREERLEALRDGAVAQAVETINNRVDEMQVREMTVMGRGTDIIVEIPGEDQAAFDRIRAVISRTARLEFKVCDDENRFLAEQEGRPEGITLTSEAGYAGEGAGRPTTPYLVAWGDAGRAALMQYVAGLTPPEGREILLGPYEGSSEEERERAEDEKGYRTWMLFDTTEVTGEDVDDAYVGYDSQNQGQPVVQLQFGSEGADSFGRMTGANVKRRMAIVLDDTVESAPVINERIPGGRCQITLGSYGSYQDTLDEANGLVVVLKAGALPAPIRAANEQLIGPTLGEDSVWQGLQGALVGVGLVLLFMIVYYEVAGLVATGMVALNLMLLLATLAFFEATLTMPGFAGIALTVGMAVDANVLITERIRDELRLGKSPRSAVDQGFGRAFWSIFDGQLTTLIAAVVLYQYGTGPIKGFAVTLVIGILTSLFTGVFCSRVVMDWIVRGLRVSRLRVG